MSDESLLCHSELHLRPNPSRTVIRPFDVDYPQAFRNDAHPRMQQIVERVLSLDSARLLKEKEVIIASLAERHRDIEKILLRRSDDIRERVPEAQGMSREAALVVGAYFSEEYSYEAAALFNPSMVLRADQKGAPPGGVRFLLSLRGIGEGHISSVTFRTGTWSPTDGFAIDEASNQAISPRIDSSAADAANEMTRIICEGSEDVSESVLFPVTASQRRGIEDLRLVRFTEEDGRTEFLGTYTAFDGADARSEVLRATGFRTFEMHVLKGSAAAAKGMALFPRKIDGRFMMLGRQDNESIWLLASDGLYCWDGGGRIVSPRFPWEFVQMGNCGSPIEIDEGWLVLTHGVGMARNYCMGACLLDKADPSKLLARTKEPILRPSPNERDGYVPNVVYSCGSIVHERTLLLPYGVADNFAAFASASVDDLLKTME
ncbi:glycoside hydrolase family 130 protein [Sphingomonas abietis]|uniref:Glycoside hydrolase family 130 protein n=1 Tax=Sphingomonas abietis TaxID=3012344 RepID=A0ABY7NUP1_9SPHN|nr:glycoside hydrolase family 130 protein [Sphingomonas abietis]WBO24277.1 glycoside hydrolase family 130 protein [Sphingomonas abietis]